MSITSMPQRKPLTEQVAAEVRSLMGRRNVTQMQLRGVLGVSQTGISKRLRGLTPFDANEIGLLAEFFEIEPSELVADHSPPTRPGGGRPGRSRRGSMSTDEYAHHHAA